MDNKIMIIKNIKGYCDSNGTAHLNTENVARGLGFTRVATSGNEVIRWETVRRYLKECGVPSCWHDNSPQVGNEGLPEYISENIFYKLCFKAKNETARKFQDFVTDEVLPSIRKTGGYIVGEENMTEDELVLTAMNVLNKKVENLRQKNEQLQLENEKQNQLIGELKPKADYTDKILRSKGTTKVNVIANDYGYSATKFNKLLYKLGIQYKQGNDWLLYVSHRGKGYTHTKTFDFVRSDGTPDSHANMEWTQKGRLFLYNTLKEKGILPMIEQNI